LVIGAYVYDAMNRRVRKTITNGGLSGNIPDGTIDYVWLGNQVMEERNPFGGSGSTDTPIKQYIWGTYIDECIQLTTLATLGPQNVPAGSYYLLQDLLYRAMALTDASGAIVEAYDTDAYGNTIIMTANWGSDSATQSAYGANDLVFCGYRYDPETQLYYVRNRTYSPTLGRWIQRDPIGYAGGINLYEYANGRAVVATDSIGMQVAPPIPVPPWLAELLLAFPEIAAIILAAGAVWLLWRLGDCLPGMSNCIREADMVARNCGLDYGPNRGLGLKDKRRCAELHRVQLETDCLWALVKCIFRLWGGFQQPIFGFDNCFKCPNSNPCKRGPGGMV
jgi:RHS repeat-associated protein